MAQQQQRIGHREGSRWIHEPPPPAELAEWFADNVRMHDGLSHAHYLPGITMIPNKEKVRQTVMGDNGAPRIVDVEQLVYVPYPKVETRIAYFWDLMLIHPDWLGEVELVLPDEPYKGLPEGFFHHPVTVGDRATHFIGVSYRVRITERRGGKPVILPAAGTKIVPLLKTGYNGRIYADPDAIHKAQTGAQGRALGYAGMLIVPGAGIATAEDMQDFIASETTSAPALPPTEEPRAESQAANLGEVVAQLVERLQSDHPKAYEEAVAWAAEKGFDLTTPPAAALRSLEKTLRKKLELAERAATAEAPA